MGAMTVGCSSAGGPPRLEAAVTGDELPGRVRWEATAKAGHCSVCHVSKQHLVVDALE